MAQSPRLQFLNLQDLPITDAGLASLAQVETPIHLIFSYCPITGAGLHRLEAIWRPVPEQDKLSEDYVPRRIRHLIPFVWSPEAAALPSAPDSAVD